MSWKESYSDQIENLISYSKLIYQRGLVSAAGRKHQRSVRPTCADHGKQYPSACCYAGGAGAL